MQARRQALKKCGHVQAGISQVDEHAAEITGRQTFAGDLSVGGNLHLDSHQAGRSGDLACEKQVAAHEERRSGDVGYRHGWPYTARSTAAALWPTAVRLTFSAVR